MNGIFNFMRRFRYGLILTFLIFFAVPNIYAGEKPRIDSLAAVLMDAKTGRVLYEKNADLPHPPASLTKIMTIHLLLEKISSGELHPEDPVSPPPESWAKNLPGDSSLMFLGPDQRPTVKDILQGLAVSSGNDAAVAAAHLAAGSIKNFTDMMNAEARRHGFSALHFTEPSGYDENNSITARDFAGFVKYYLERHPDSLETLHSLRDFTYPRRENILPGNGSSPITQHNRNRLLYTYDGADGIKTGYLHESGFNIALTARRNGMRLILILLGASGVTPRQGDRNRSTESRALLDYGFDNFTTIKTEYPAPNPVTVWMGRKRSLIPAGPSEIWVTVPKGREKFLRGIITQRDYITAPVPTGTPIGVVRVYDGDDILYSADLVSPSFIEKGPWWRILGDGIFLFFRKIFGYPV
jgi:D-alanyl-D-alanine carboxypeptidase (penicillin-binding protein 5/6)